MHLSSDLLIRLVDQRWAQIHQLATHARWIARLAALISTGLIGR
jgi:hypothetical protein